jgi:TRAP-type C4-dicarboxylate transport system permease small subunit
LTARKRLRRQHLSVELVVMMMMMMVMVVLVVFSRVVGGHASRWI